MSLNKPKPIARINVKDLETNKVKSMTLYENGFKKADEIIEKIKEVFK